jgi:cell division transport system permease protein
MDWGKIRFFLSEVGRNFTRNAVMQLTAIGTVTVMILLLGTFLFARETLAKIGQGVIGKIEISVFLTDKATPVDAKRLGALIRSDRRVRSFTYIPKAAGLKMMRDRLRGQIDTSLLTSNPLPDAFRVRVVDPTSVRALAASLAKLPNVAKVEYQSDAVDRLLRFSDVMGKVGLAFILLLVATSAIIISNTIRLTVFARRREIAIMQLVGASGTYIRLPFICEGLVYGLAGALLAVILLGIGHWQLWPKFASALPFLPLNDADIDLLTFAFELIGVGAFVGIAAAWISVGRYLRT